MPLKTTTYKLLVFLALLVLISQAIPLDVFGQGAVVRCVLFYSPYCSHCHALITETLPPLVEVYGGTPDMDYIPPTLEEEPVGSPLIRMYGETLEILYVNTATELGYTLYSQAAELYDIPPEGQVVPLMIIDDVILTGGAEIPQRFPELVEAGIDAGGVDLPALPDLQTALSRMVSVETSEPQPTSSPMPGETPEDLPLDPTTTEETSVPSDGPSITTELSIGEKIRLDPLGNGLSILVLVGMIATVGYVGLLGNKSRSGHDSRKSSYLIPILSLVGLVIAGYLTYVEASGDLTVCGPVGDCNTVQQSPYATLFGFLPVGTVGLLGYIAIITAWLTARLSSPLISAWSSVLLFLMTTVGVLFSIYLTFLEPFVIGASCAWCLSSAVIITILFWLSKDSGLAAYYRLQRS
jgi:uncharacterized membrane protein